MERVPKSIKSGRDKDYKSYEDTIVKAFINSFLAVLMRKNWITVMLYSQHNNLNITSDLIRQCLQFNVFSQIGFGNKIKEDFVRVALTCKLYPEECEDKPYLKRVLEIFPLAHQSEIDGSESCIKFIMNYSKQVFKDDIDSLITEVLYMNKEYNTEKEILEIRRRRKLDKSLNSCPCTICKNIRYH